MQQHMQDALLPTQQTAACTESGTIPANIKRTKVRLVPKQPSISPPGCHRHQSAEKQVAADGGGGQLLHHQHQHRAANTAANPLTNQVNVHQHCSPRPSTTLTLTITTEPLPMKEFSPTSSDEIEHHPAAMDSDVILGHAECPSLDSNSNSSSPRGSGEQTPPRGLDYEGPGPPAEEENTSATTSTPDGHRSPRGGWGDLVAWMRERPQQRSQGARRRIAESVQEQEQRKLTIVAALPSFPEVLANNDVLSPSHQHQNTNTEIACIGSMGNYLRSASVTHLSLSNMINLAERSLGVGEAMPVRMSNPLRLSPESLRSIDFGKSMGSDLLSTSINHQHLCNMINLTEGRMGEEATTGTSNPLRLTPESFRSMDCLNQRLGVDDVGNSIGSDLLSTSVAPPHLANMINLTERRMGEGATTRSNPLQLTPESFRSTDCLNQRLGMTSFQPVVPHDDVGNSIGSDLLSTSVAPPHLANMINLTERRMGEGATNGTSNPLQLSPESFRSMDCLNQRLGMSQMVHRDTRVTRFDHLWQSIPESLPTDQRESSGLSTSDEERKTEKKKKQSKKICFTE